MDKVLLVFIGGGLGSLARFGTAVLSARWFGTSFPWGTAIVNLAGCFLIGLVYGIAERTSWIGPGARLFVMTGFLGGLTTFSAFAVESVAAGRQSGAGALLLNVLINNVGGLALAAAGILAAKWVR
ncbi:MAG: fluoride efflux transporter CrcB [Kiritimatiellae bacterium]|nr:fluoride efflux transporter CrcB [Kiritimatiellia bacterium]MDW8458942.1 fluoride efflux transporter CrcB [Verrucomicrobiota bacterium]